MAARAGGRGRGRGRGFSSPHAPRPGGRSPAAASAGHDDSVYDFEDEDQDEDDHDAWPGTKAKTGGAKRSRVPTASAVAAADAAAKKPKKAQKVKKPAAKKQPIAAYESSRLELVASGAGGLTGRGRRNGVMLNLHAFTDGTPVTLAALATEVVDGLERSDWVLGKEYNLPENLQEDGATVTADNVLQMLSYRPRTKDGKVKAGSAITLRSCTCTQPGSGSLTVLVNIPSAAIACATARSSASCSRSTSPSTGTDLYPQCRK